ncbi:MAG: hypothetical protein ACOYMS_06485, partial [Terrimicrobiaceae bacterium]
MMTPAAVLQYLAKNEERFIEELFAYTRIPSISAQSDHAADMRRSAEWLAARCTKAGLKAEIRKTTGYPVVIAKTPNPDPKKPTFLVYGHYDVQPPDPLDLW